MGQKMAESAKKAQYDMNKFQQIKNHTAKQIMIKQWGEQLKIKNNEEVVDRIFT